MITYRLPSGSKQPITLWWNQRICHHSAAIERPFTWLSSSSAPSYLPHPRAGAPRGHSICLPCAVMKWEEEGGFVSTVNHLMKMLRGCQRQQWTFTFLQAPKPGCIDICKDFNSSLTASQKRLIILGHSLDKCHLIQGLKQVSIFMSP